MLTLYRARVTDRVPSGDLSDDNIVCDQADRRESVRLMDSVSFLGAFSRRGTVSHGAAVLTCRVSTLMRIAREFTD
jgi:hypothetical protein